MQRRFAFVAPVLDASGLHARECACQRCELGFRPTDGDRFAAAEALRMVEADKEKRAKRVRSAEVTAASIALQRELAAALVARTRDAEKKAAAPPEGGFAAYLAEQRREKK